MIKLFKKFRESEYGAVTVDWVVLTAAVVALAGAAYTAIGNNTKTLSDAVATEIGTTVPTIAGAGGGS
ncbi:hypothetical protein [Pseudodonghicola xiamenensis]|uniref:Flp pilus assembly protein, pilin Flp n=1 Tax=Pseudodonghicola xiamenensis TaxID=337702 RepID=A0A8J3MDW5_9RHOB|nr:hypothetical protein [Pseudodonghicola xiamenensis]GHG94401.1 hypothetical protein GCM10010961_27520 [Pseudodonghicola xiamenensis]